MKARLRSESTLFNINDHECSQSTFPVYESLRKDGSIFFFSFFFATKKKKYPRKEGDTFEIHK